MFLTVSELEQLTGYKPRQRKRQLAWLKAKGYKHDINARGEILVARGHVEQRFGDGAPPTQEPDFSVFRQADDNKEK